MPKPITGVWKFQHKVEAFFSKYLLSNTHPLDHITDYVIKIEFEVRGSPHAHCLLLVKDAPKIDKDPDDVVCAFIDKYITAVTPPVAPDNEHDIKLMDNLQKHTHSDYCCRNNLAILVFQNHWQEKPYISTTYWWSWQNNRKCKITPTDCAKHTYNSRCTS